MAINLSVLDTQEKTVQVGYRGQTASITFLPTVLEKLQFAATEKGLDKITDENQIFAELINQICTVVTDWDLEIETDDGVITVPIEPDAVKLAVNPTLIMAIIEKLNGELMERPKAKQKPSTRRTR